MSMSDEGSRYYHHYHFNSSMSISDAGSSCYHDHYFRPNYSCKYILITGDKLPIGMITYGGMRDHRWTQIEAKVQIIFGCIK